MTGKYLTVGWERLHTDSRTLAARLRERLPVRGIVAISRGGLVPAAVIARELECRVLETICVVTYDEQQRGEPRVVKAPDAAGDGAGWLLIDDLVDTGTTARVARALLPHAHFATVYAKPAGLSVVQSFVEQVPQDTWILFPWDSAPQFVPPLARA